MNEVGIVQDLMSHPRAKELLKPMGHYVAEIYGLELGNKKLDDKIQNAQEKCGTVNQNLESLNKKKEDKEL